MNEEQQKQYEMTVLEAYFRDRSNKALSGYVLERKNSEDIRAELAEIMPIPNERILEYLMENDYCIGCDSSGRMTWKIWRKLELEDGEDPLEGYDYD